MKKKLIATLIASAVLSTGIIGLTACGGGNDTIKKGEEVDAAGWKAAITATVEAKNFTMDQYEEYNTTMTGNMGEIKDVNISGKSTVEGKYYFDIDNGTAYFKQTVKSTVSGVPDELKDEDEFKAADYIMEAYVVKDGDTYYSADYDTYSKEPQWSVRETTSVGGNMSYILDGEYSTTKDGETAELIDLYEAFTYAKGVYTATLWNNSREETISVSIKGGYVVGYSEEYTREEGDETKITNVIKTVINYSDYGKTTVKASDEAKKAVEDYKAE